MAWGLTDYHQTTYDGSTLRFSWTGIAIYLYGQAVAASFTIAVDGNASTSSGVTIPAGGELGMRNGLTYGSHTVVLTTHGTGLVAFQDAEVTIGVGYAGYVTQPTTIRIRIESLRYL